MCMIYSGFTGMFEIFLVFAILSIFVPFTDGLIKKNPWDFENDRPMKQAETSK